MEINNELKNKVWEKATIIKDYNPDIYRQDPCGAWIIYDKYGVTDNMYGWQIDHIYPESRLLQLGIPKEKIDDLINLRPMNHINNNSKSDDYPSYIARCTSDGNKNIEIEKSFVVNKAKQEELSKFYNLQ